MVGKPVARSVAVVEEEMVTDAAVQERHRRRTVFSHAESKT
jgi:hypothetical protein